jgi:hypothetical protein
MWARTELYKQGIQLRLLTIIYIYIHYVLLHWVGDAFLFLAFASVDAHNLLFALLQCFKILGLQFITIVINKDDFYSRHQKLSLMHLNTF